MSTEPNTYESPRKCCKQKTYARANSFSCNTYKKHRVGTRLAHPTRTCILSPPTAEESKDSSPASLFVVLCTKSVSQFLYNQAVPHSFSKLPGVYQQFPFWNSAGASPRCSCLFFPNVFYLSRPGVVFQSSWEHGRNVWEL